jgi:hypothetical protein
LFSLKPGISVLIRTATSPLSLSIVGDIERFINDNATAASTDREGKPEDGAKAISHAIAYGIAKALSSQLIQNAFVIGGICLPAGGPVGQQIHTMIQSVSTEVG